MAKLRKIFAVSVIVMTVVAMSGLVAPKASASASAGDLIKKDGLSTVYYLGSDGKRYVFPNSDVYFSWYPDFSGVVTVSASELSSYSLGSNIVMRAGTKLVKIVSDPSVYAVEPNGVLRKIQSEADAIALYGSNWAKRVVDVIDSFFTGYTVGSVLASGSVPAGSLVKNAGAANVYYYDGTNYRSIATEAAFNANRFAWANVMTIANTITAGGTAISGAEADLIKTSQNGTSATTTDTGTGLTASLSSATPASINIPGNVPVEFLKINLTASSDGNVNVSGIKLTAYDLGDSTAIDDVTFYDNGEKVGTSKNINSDRYAIFNFSTPILVNASFTKTLTVKATIGDGADAGTDPDTGSYALGIATASDITTGGATVAGTFPVRGNSMSAVTSAAMGDVTLNAVSLNQTATNSFGDDNVLLAGFDLTANNEDILAQSFSFKNGGTGDAINNLKLYADGTEIASGTYADGYATFALNNYKLPESDAITFEVRGDLGVGNVGDTVNLYIKNKADFIFVGKTYGFASQITTATFTNFDGANDGIKTTLAAGDFTLDMDKSATTGTPNKDVKAGDNDVVLATLFMKSNSENAVVEQIVDNGAHTFEIQGAGLEPGELENIEMVDVATGGIYDVAVIDDSHTTYWTLSMVDEIPLVAGVSKKFLIRADFSDAVATPIDPNDTVKVTVAGAAMTITGDASEAPITNVTPSSVTSATATVKDASLTWTAVSLTNKSVVGSATDVEMYRATLVAGTSDSVKLNSVKISTTNVNEDAFSNDNITKLDLYLDGKLLKTVSNDIVEAAAGTVGTITFNSLSTTNNANVISSGSTVNLVVKATFASTLIFADDTFALELAVPTTDVVSRSVVGNKPVSVTTGTGGSRNITTASNGTLKVELLTTDTKADENALLLAGSETPANRYMGELKFTTANEAVKVTKLSLVDNNNADSSDIKEIKLIKFVSGVPTTVASKLVEANGDVTFDPFNVVFPADQATSLFIVAVARGMNVETDPASQATAGHILQYNINPTAGVVAVGDNSSANITIVVNPGGAVGTGEWSEAAVKSMVNVVTGSTLVSVTNPMSDGVLQAGTSKIIGKYTFTFDNGANRDTVNNEMKAILDSLKISWSKSSTLIVEDVKAYLEGTSVKVAADTLHGTTTGVTTGDATWNSGTLAAGLSGGGEVDGAVTLIITGNVTPDGTADGEYLQTSIADLDGTGDFSFIGDGPAGHATITTMYLPITEVLGATLQE